MNAAISPAHTAAINLAVTAATHAHVAVPSQMNGASYPETSEGGSAFVGLMVVLSLGPILVLCGYLIGQERKRPEPKQQVFEAHPVPDVLPAWLEDEKLL